MPYTVQFMSALPRTTLHRVLYLQVTWTDSTDPNAASINVYRGLTTGGPYSLLTNMPLGVQLYNDFNVSPGVNYFYVTTEVNNVGVESGFSVEQFGNPGVAP